MKSYAVLFLIFLLGCGSEDFADEEQDSRCQPSNIGYLHTALHCGEFVPENVTSIFVICDPLKTGNRNGCCQEDTMRELEDNCFLTNVCMEPWDYE